ncbi:MAG: Nif3-like dinuclear metal center hexameric protein [Thermodesulfobacteriota bacterium]
MKPGNVSPETMKLDELVGYLDGYLGVDRTPDYPNAMNGLQVEGAGEVTKVVTAVDATVASARKAVELGAGMLIVHHGIFWDGLRPITGRMRLRLEPLLAGGVSLYSAHLPLDAHPEVGNNAVLARLLGLDVAGRFGEFQDVVIGVYSDAEVALDDLSGRVAGALGAAPRVLGLGPSTTARVGVVSGGGGSAIAQAAASGIDTVVTGEISHNNYFDAEEYGVNVICAGHYATETVGVKALGERLRDRFSLDCVFFDHPTGL